MTAERDRKLNLSDPGRDAAGEEIERLLKEDADAAEGDAADDSGHDSFLERFPAAPTQRRRSD